MLILVGMQTTPFPIPKQDRVFRDFIARDKHFVNVHFSPPCGNANLVPENPQYLDQLPRNKKLTGRIKNYDIEVQFINGEWKPVFDQPLSYPYLFDCFTPQLTGAGYR
jgi:hypothetical protein